MNARVALALAGTTILTVWAGAASAQTVSSAPSSSPNVGGTIAEAPAQTASPTTGTPETSGTSTSPPTEPAGASAAGVGDIVVTAQRREQRLQDVPVAVSVTSGATLAKQNLVTLDSIANRLPAIKVTRNTNSDTIAIRGVGSGQNAGFEQAVGTFVDGVYRGRSRSSRAALFDAERVEVLKGPQTTFFGNNTVAGAINITTRKPSDTFGMEARSLYTPNIGEYSFDLSITGPITDTLSYRVAGQAYGMNGYVHNVYEDSDGPRLRDLAGRISLSWYPISTFRSNFRVDRIHNRDTNTDTPEVTNCPAPAAYGRTVGACALYLAQRGSAADTKLNYRNDTLGLFFRYNMTEAAWTNSLNLGPDTLTSISSYFHHRVNVTSNSQPVALTTPFAGYPARGIFQNDESDRNFTQELRFETPAGHLFQLTTGAYYLHDRLRSNGLPGFYASPFGQLFAPSVYTAADPIALNRQLRQLTDTKSVFAALVISPVKRFRINLGARYTSVRKEAHRYALLGRAGPIAGLDNFIAAPAAVQPALAAGLGVVQSDFPQNVTNYSKFLPSASVQYDIARTLTAYASFTKGFKAGGYAESSIPNTFGSETVRSYEVGVKGTVLGRVFVTLDAFTSKFKDLQTAYTFVSSTGVSNSLIANAAGARSRGVEGSLSYRVNDHITFKTDLAYVDAIFTSYPNGPCSDILLAANPRSCVQNQTGRTRPFAPKLSGSASVSVVVPIAGRQLRVDPLVYFSSKYNVSETLDPLLVQRGYAKFDLRLGYGPESGKWEFAVIGKNLTDKYTFGIARTLATSLGSYYVFPDPPRTVSIQASVKF